MPTKDIVLASHQKLASDFMIRNPRCALYLDVGYGKTLTTLYTLDKVRPNGNILVVGPLNVMKATWADEIEKWGFGIRHRSLIVNEKGVKLSKAKRLALYDQISDDEPAMYFLNQDLIVDIVEHFKAKKRKWPFLVMIIDEAQTFGDPTTKKFKAISSIAHQSPVFIELTGTPAADSLMELWGPNWLIDKGAALGEKISQYQAKYFVPDLVMHNVTVKWRPAHKTRTRVQIFDAIKHQAISVENHDLKLPDVTHNEMSVHLDPDVLDAYHDFAENQVLALARERLAQQQHAAEPGIEQVRITTDIDLDDALDIIEGVNPAVLRNKLMQFASGTAYVMPTYCKDCGEPITVDYVPRVDASGRPVMDVETDTQVLDPVPVHLDPATDADHKVKLPPHAESYRRIHTAKVDSLETIINNAGSPVMVAYKYQAEVTEITKELVRRKLPRPVRFDGSRTMTRDWNAGAIPVMLIHPASAGAGLNLQESCHTLVWYTPTTSNKQFIQTNGRIARPGQKHPVVIHQLLAAGTFDEKVPDVLAGKSEVQDALKDHVRRIPTVSEAGLLHPSTR